MVRTKLICAFLLVAVLGVTGTAFSKATPGKSELAVYSGPPNSGWISAAACEANAKTIVDDVRMKKLFGSIRNFGDGTEKGPDSPLGKWVKGHTGNGRQDVLITASGTCPSALYQFPNKNPDGSPVEEFVEAGNVVINVADWIFYMSYEGGVRSADNAADGAANVFDIPGLSSGDRGTDFQPTDLGKKYIPSLKPFNSTRPWHMEQFEGKPWKLHAFAVDKADKNSGDPVVAVSTEKGRDGNGMIAAMWQKDAPEWADKPDPRGIGVVEFISNWLTGHGNMVAVEPQGKLSTAWAKIKNN